MRVSNVTVRRRLFIALLVGIVLYSLLITRLGYIQLLKGQELRDKAVQLWSRDIPVEAKRGRILDRNGEVLAYNVSMPTVMAFPVQIKDPARTARELSRILQVSEEKIYQQITKRTLIVRIQPGGRKISEEKAKRIQELNLPGIVIVEDSKRYYPRGAFASHVLGFTGIDNQGLSGIETVYNDRLQGTRGHVSFFATAKGEIMPNQKQFYTPPRDGLDLVLTIDANIQAIIERELDRAMLELSPNDIIAVAMDPHTGEILGMASRPNYEPGRFAEYPSEVYNRNLPIWKTYEPGSTFKIITLAAALEEGKVNLENEHFHDPGYINVAGVHLHCWRRGGHGQQTFLEVVENSCNPGFVTLGQRLGKQKLLAYLDKFGFGHKTGIDLPGEENGVMFKPERMGPVELATTAFGQGVSVTPIQQVAAVSAAINGGFLYKPFLAKEWHDPETGEVLEINTPELKRRVLSAETSAKVRHALESVVAKGTGRNAFIDGYRVGGKTGTAQKVGPNGQYLRNEHIVSFIGFAPADDPRIIVYVAVDNPQGIQFGGVVAAPIVREILDSSLRYLNVKPRSNQLEREYRYGDTRMVTVPDFTGMSVHEIRQSYFSFPVEIDGEGNRVIDQAPDPGVKVVEGSTIRLYLGDKLPQGN
ncbi:stage V sporulation protein D [Bacillaceae bacterium]